MLSMEYVTKQMYIKVRILALYLPKVNAFSFLKTWWHYDWCNLPFPECFQWPYWKSEASDFIFVLRLCSCRLAGSRSLKLQLLVVDLWSCNNWWYRSRSLKQVYILQQLQRCKVDEVRSLRCTQISRRTIESMRERAHRCISIWAISIGRANAEYTVATLN